MVVVGTACLDISSLRMCHEATIEQASSSIAPESVRFIVKVRASTYSPGIGNSCGDKLTRVIRLPTGTQTLATQYYDANKKVPERVLIYRSAGQDGSFNGTFRREPGIRQCRIRPDNLSSTIPKIYS
jgi:hypothetical protein